MKNDLTAQFSRNSYKLCKISYHLHRFVQIAVVGLLWVAVVDLVWVADVSLVLVAVVDLVWVATVSLVWVAFKGQPFYYMHGLYCLNVLTSIVLCSFHLSLSIPLYCLCLSLLSYVGHLYQLTLIVDAKEYPQSVAV